MGTKFTVYDHGVSPAQGPGPGGEGLHLVRSWPRVLRECHLAGLLTSLGSQAATLPAPPCLFPCVLRFTCDPPSPVYLLFGRPVSSALVPPCAVVSVSAHCVPADTLAGGDSDLGSWSSCSLQAGLLWVAAASGPAPAGSVFRSAASQAAPTESRVQPGPSASPSGPPGNPRSLPLELRSLPL